VEVRVDDVGALKSAMQATAIVSLAAGAGLTFQDLIDAYANSVGQTPEAAE